MKSSRVSLAHCLALLKQRIQYLGPQYSSDESASIPSMSSSPYGDEIVIPEHMIMGPYDDTSVLPVENLSVLWWFPFTTIENALLHRRRVLDLCQVTLYYDETNEDQRMYDEEDFMVVVRYICYQENTNKKNFIIVPETQTISYVQIINNVYQIHLINLNDGDWDDYLCTENEVRLNKSMASSREVIECIEDSLEDIL